jgi:hypothetical protein
MLRLDNGGGVLGDVSYLAPDGCGYSVPQYWRMTFHGSRGVIECDPDRSPLTMALATDTAAKLINPDPAVPNAAIESFLKEASGADQAELSTADVLEAARLALRIQYAADNELRDMPL